MLLIQGTENSKPASPKLILLSRRRRANYTSSVKFVMKLRNLRIRIYTVFNLSLTFACNYKLFNVFRPFIKNAESQIDNSEFFFSHTDSM